MNAGNNIVDEIKTRCDIVDVIGRVVSLKKAGSNYKGLCPFHNEKTPSFNVNAERQIYKCFGCGESGDVIRFVEKYYNQDFRGACEMLAGEYGIDIRGSFGSSDDKKELYEINRQAALFFYRTMRQRMNPGYTYMKGRGISEGTMNQFGIGYADGQWDSLLNHLTGLGFPRRRLVQLGLVTQNGNRYYDKFRNRVIFPIINTSGKVIGFGGRILGDGNPKYLNSQESDIFLKKNNLYGLNLAKSEVAAQDQIILVEGYMDVVSLYQAGIRNVCASLGTALTESQARLIKRYTKNVILSYDADAAGQNAAMRGVDILYGEDLRPRVLKVTDGKDPDEFIKKNGRAAFRQLAEEALPIGDFKMQRIADQYDLTDEQGRLAYLREVLESLRVLKPVEADLYLNKLAEQTGISAQAIRLEFGSDGAIQPPVQQIRRREQPDRDQVPAVSEAERTLLALMLQNLKYTRLPEDIAGYVLGGGAAAGLAQALGELRADGGSGPADTGRLRERLEPEGWELLRSVSDTAIPAEKEQVLYDQCVAYIRRELLQQRDREITWQLSLEDGSLSEEEMVSLMQEQAQIQKTLKCGTADGPADADSIG